MKTLKKQVSQRRRRARRGSRPTTCSPGADRLAARRSSFRRVENVTPDEMRQLIDVMRRKRETGLAVLLAAASEGKVQLVAGFSKDLIDRGLHAGNWLKEVAPVVGGGGGGRPDLAQAGGKSRRTSPPRLKRHTRRSDRGSSRDGRWPELGPGVEP